MEPTTSQNTKKDTGLLDDFKKGNATNQPMLIGGHEIRAIRNLKYVQKNPNEAYFEGTNKEKQRTKRKIRSKTEMNNLTDFVHFAPINDIRSPATSKEEEESQREENAVARKQLEFKLYRFQKLREYNEQKNQTQQRLAEKNYLEELENMAETYVEYKKRRKQLTQMQDFYLQRPPRKTRDYNKIGCSIISLKYWNDDKNDDSSKGKEKKKEIQKDTEQKLDCEKLGEELQEKLVLFWEDKN